jgi:hypothetical protein
MRQVILVITAVALICAAGYVMAQSAAAPAAPKAPGLTAAGVTTPAEPDRADRDTQLRLARMDTSLSAFRKLDRDNDGRISALEAADSAKVAAAFTLADKDKDGYLSKEEFQAMGTTNPHSADVDASSPSGDHVSSPSGDHVSSPGGDQPAEAPAAPQP